MLESMRRSPRCRVSSPCSCSSRAAGLQDMRVYRHWRSQLADCFGQRKAVSVLVPFAQRSQSIPPFACHVLRVRNFLQISIPRYLPSCAQIVPKADQEGPSRTPARLPVAIMRFKCRHTCYPSRSSSRVREKQRRR